MKLSIGNYILIFLFIAFIVFPAIDKRLGISTVAYYHTENRPMAPKPAFEINDIEKFPVKFDNYYTDNFRLRGQIMKLYSKLCIRIFDKSPIPDLAMVGKNGWLFMTRGDLDIYQGLDLFTVAELKSICNELTYRNDYLSKRNCKFYFVVVPAKTRVYSDHLPDNIQVVNHLGYGEQLIQYLQKNSSVAVINLYDTLRRQRKNGRVFLKTDNHWNELGAYFAGQAILQNIKKDFQQIPLLPLEMIELDSTEIGGGHTALMLSLGDEMKEFVHHVSPNYGWHANEGKKRPYIRPAEFNFAMDYEFVKEQTDTTLPKIVVIRDSFGNSLIPTFSESFSKAVYILDNWRYGLNEEIINTEKPDIVLIMVYEPLIKNLRWFHSSPNEDTGKIITDAN